jgi:hypothetical protein
VPKIDQSGLKIDDQHLSESQTASFGEISLEDFKIPGVTVNQEINTQLNAISMADFKIPAITKDESFGASMAGYKPTALSLDDIQVSGGRNQIFSGISLPPDPGGSPTPIKIGETDPVSFQSTNPIDYAISVPEGVSDIGNILLQDNPAGKFEVSVELAGAEGVITTGKIIPDITVYPSGLFTFKNSLAGGIIAFTAEDSLTTGNHFKKTKTFELSSLNISGNPVNGVLSVSDQVVSNGSVRLSGAYVMSNKINEIASLDLIIKVSVNDVVIKSMELNIPTIQSTLSGSTTFQKENTLPGEITQINSVNIDPTNNTLTFKIQAKPGTLPPMISSQFKINSLQITFPDEFVFEPTDGLSGNTYSLQNTSFNPETGKLITLKLNRINTSSIPVSQSKWQWSSSISYNGTVSFSGRINSTQIPSADNDTKMRLLIESSLQFKSAEVVTTDITKQLNLTNVPLTFNINIAKMVKRLNVVNLKPGSKIRIAIRKPTLPLPLVGNNLVIQFPDLFVFKPELPNNRLTYHNQEIPDNLELELAAFRINQDLDDGTLKLNENIQL